MRRCENPAQGDRVVEESALQGRPAVASDSGPRPAKESALLGGPEEAGQSGKDDKNKLEKADEEEDRTEKQHSKYKKDACARYCSRICKAKVEAIARSIINEAFV